MRDSRRGSRKQPERAFLIFFLLISFLLPVQTDAAVADVDVIHSRDKYTAGEAYPIMFRIRVSDSWYIHGPLTSDEGLIPTKLSFTDTGAVKVRDIRFPEAERKIFEYAREGLDVYSGDVFIRAKLLVGKEVKAGEIKITGNLSYQACSDTSCLPPEDLKFPLLLSLASKGTWGEPVNREMFESEVEQGALKSPYLWQRGRAGFWLTLLGIFAGGLALNLTPCIYPLIPITVSYFGGKGDRAKGKALVHGMFYLSGLSLTNSMLGVISSLTGSLLGSVLQSPYVLIGLAAVMTWLGLSFFGLWELRLPLALTRTASKNYTGYFGTFFMGLTLGVVAAPCLGPFILGLLTYVGRMGDPLLGFLYFFVLSLGMGLPLTVLAIFSGALDKLPFSGEWMVWVRKFMGWVLLAMGGYIIQPLIAVAAVKSAVISLIIVSAGIHLGWIEKSGNTSQRFKILKMTTALVLICSGVLFFAGSISEHKGIDWVPYDEDVLLKALNEEKPVLLDFYADWCGPCVAMERGIFRDPDVIRISRDIIPVRVDLTKKQPYQEKLLERFRVRGVPTIIFINRSGVEERELRVESYDDRLKVPERMQSLIQGGR